MKVNVVMHCKILLILLSFFCSDIFGSGFGAGTLVHTTAGLIPIEKVALGDYVHCYDILGNQTQKVTHKKYTFEKNCAALVLHNADGVIVVSRQQEFYMPKEGIWKKAGDLKTGDTLLQFNTHHATIQAIHELPKITLLFDLSVEECHNYFVSHKGVLVHNFAPAIGICISLAVDATGIEFLGASLYLGVCGVILGIKAFSGKKPPDDPPPPPNDPPRQDRRSDDYLGQSMQNFHNTQPLNEFKVSDDITLKASLNVAPFVEKTVERNVASSDPEISSWEALSLENEHKNADNSITGLACTTIISPENPLQNPGCGDANPKPKINHTGDTRPKKEPTPDAGCGDIIKPGSFPIHTGHTQPIVFNGPFVFCIDKAPFDGVLDDILKDAKPGRKTGGSLIQYEKEGDFSDAVKDFEKLGPLKVHPIPTGSAGILPDGRDVNVRTKSSAKKTTLEIINKTTKQRVKIRYGH